jgi:hypothetical protein
MRAARHPERIDRRRRESLPPALETPSAFLRRAQRNAFRRGVRQQSRLFSFRNPQLRHSPIPSGLLRLSAIKSKDCIRFYIFIGNDYEGPGIKRGLAQPVFMN